MAKSKKRRQKKARNMVVLGMLLHCKGGAMKDKRTERGGCKNEQRELLAELDVRLIED